MARPYQVRREQLTDREWSDLCEFFSLARDLARRIEERKAAGAVSPEKGRNNQ